MTRRRMWFVVVLFVPLIVLPIVLGASRYLGYYGAYSTARLVAELDSPQPGTAIHGLYYLRNRSDPVAVTKAVELLHSKDDYIWLNAALYLGECKRKEAIPYLIKALRHTAWRSDAEKQRYLKALTQQDFGSDFNRWVQWWKTQPDSQNDFNWEDNLGHRPRM